MSTGEFNQAPQQEDPEINLPALGSNLARGHAEVCPHHEDLMCKSERRPIAYHRGYYTYKLARFIETCRNHG